MEASKLLSSARLSTRCSHMFLYCLLQFFLLCSHHFAQKSSLFHKHKSRHCLNSKILSNTLQSTNYLSLFLSKRINITIWLIACDDKCSMKYGMLTEISGLIVLSNMNLYIKKHITIWLFILPSIRLHPPSEIWHL